MQEAIVRALQDIRTPFWNATFTVATGLGEELFVLAVAALIYWNLSKRGGYVLVLAYLATMTVNDLLKLIVQAPHPHQVLTGVYALSVTEIQGFSFPSGHTQGATTLFVTLALLFRRNAMYLITAAVLALVGVSRVYLGIHWPLDVLGGWILGSAVAVGIYRGLWARSRPLSPEHREQGEVTAVVISGATVLAVVTVSVGLLTALVTANLQSTEMARIGGAGIGAFIGFALERTTGGFIVEAPRPKRVVRYLLGLLTSGGVIAGVEALRTVAPAGFGASYVVDALLYVVIGAWVTGVYPVLGRYLGLFHGADRSAGGV